MSNAKRKTAAVPSRAVRKNVIGNRLVIFSLVLIAAVIAIMMLKRSYLSTVLAFYNYVRPVLIPVFALLTVGAVTLFVVRKSRGVDERDKYLPASLMMILSAGLFAICTVYTVFSGTRLLVTVLACAALYYVYYLYPRSFFTYSLLTVTGGILLSLERFCGGLIGSIVLAVLVAGVLAVLLVVLLAPGSALGRFAAVSDGERYPFYVTAAILLVGLCLLLLLPTLLSYAVAVLFGAYLVIAIINTLKMM